MLFKVTCSVNCLFSWKFWFSVFFVHRCDTNLNSYLTMHNVTSQFVLDAVMYVKPESFHALRISGSWKQKRFLFSSQRRFQKCFWILPGQTCFQWLVFQWLGCPAGSANVVDGPHEIMERERERIVFMWCHTDRKFPDAECSSLSQDRRYSVCVSVRDTQCFPL